ncbi:MAG TPA: hypothetical protein VKE69_08270 [Planctomycetota bacterium]|nr:hypothetical protein [Planctomycetota bacterium]
MIRVSNRIGAAARYAVVLAAATVGVSCAASTKVTQPLRGAPPATVAVLPLDGGDLSPRGRAIVRRLVGSALDVRNYRPLDDEFLDQQLALAGFQPWKPKWLPADADLAAFGRSVGVEALLVAEGFEDSRFNAGLFFRRGLTGRLRLLDVATAKSVWAAEVGASGTGGVLTGSGQIVKSFSETVEAGSELAFVRFASNIALDVMDALPPNQKPPAERERPRIENVAVQSAQGAALQPDDFLRVEAQGTPRGRASASVGGGYVDYPLVEVAPGTYRGTIRVYAGVGEGEAPATVALYDAYGAASEPRKSDAKVAFQAPRLDAPSGLVAEILDPATRRVRVRWQPTRGASEYLVARTTTTRPLKNFDRITSTEIEDLLPPDASSANYFVTARSAPGVNSGKSSVSVSF